MKTLNCVRSTKKSRNVLVFVDLLTAPTDCLTLTIQIWVLNVHRLIHSLNIRLCPQKNFVNCTKNQDEGEKEED